MVPGFSAEAKPAQSRHARRPDSRITSLTARTKTNVRSSASAFRFSVQHAAVAGFSATTPKEGGWYAPRVVNEKLEQTREAIDRSPPWPAVGRHIVPPDSLDPSRRPVYPSSVLHPCLPVLHLVARLCFSLPVPANEGDKLGVRFLREHDLGAVAEQHLPVPRGGEGEVSYERHSSVVHGSDMNKRCVCVCVLSLAATA